MQNGKIGVTTENIFPVIKKFLYSDHEIFLRELISNAVDATQKLRTLSLRGEYQGPADNLKVTVIPNEQDRTLTISDNGIGMTAEEVDRYINQIAFSSAEEFMEKYKDQAIIGHFGLGFYSSFMVSDSVEIRTQSYRDDAPTAHWTCDGSPEYTLEECQDKGHRGTDIILHLSEDCAEFSKKEKIEEMLKKYCHFLPVEIACGKKQEWKDGKYTDTDEDNIVNDTDPLWVRKPADLKDEDYAEFYRKLYPMSEEPLFHIHLNIDYPFHLTGILYFPKIRDNFEIQKNRIQLYCNQVFVTDSVEGIVPEFLMLLHGVIDSPDIPLNVSRSYLQGDSNVKKISGYITRKVADRLQEIFSTQRAEYEDKWDDLRLFIEYGTITDEKFAEKAEKFMLLRNTEGKHFTLEEYAEAIREKQTDKNSDLIYLYTEDPTGKWSFIENAKAKGYDVLVLDGPLDSHFINWFESKHEKTRFERVDANVVEKLIEKDETIANALSTSQQELLRPVFEGLLQSDDKSRFNVSFEPMDSAQTPVSIVQDEYMRRMKDMAKVSGGGMSQFYSQMPDSYTLVVNANHQLVARILEDVEGTYGSALKEIDGKIETAQARDTAIMTVIKDRKEDELSQEEKDERDAAAKELASLKVDRRKRLEDIGRNNDAVKQLVDLALLSNGMLRGEKLSDFIKRSVDMIR